MKGLKTYLIIGGAVLLLYIIAQFNRPKAIDWSETLSNKEKTPYGTYILYNRAADLFPGAHITPYREPVYNAIVDDSIKNSSYIIICPQIDISKVDYIKLTDYIKKSNDVFISAQDFGELLEKKLDVKTQTILKFNEDPIPINFVNPNLDSVKYYSVDKGSTNIYFSKFDTVKAVVLGQDARHKANFIKYTFGKGSLYLTSNPKMFSNYSLLKPDGAGYAATALSYVKNTRNIIWDEYYTQGDIGEDSPMRVFLSNEYLQWAYYITIFSLLLFILYEIKRRQRIIPVIEPLRNSTLDFVNIVGQLYYEKRNNANIAHKKVLYLLAHLRDEYQLKTNKLDQEFIEKLSSKMGIDANFAYDFVNLLNFISVQDRVSDRELIELNRIIEQFYIQSR